MVIKVQIVKLHNGLSYRTKWYVRYFISKSEVSIKEYILDNGDTVMFQVTTRIIINEV